MFLWGLVANIFWALIIAIILWILCAFAGRLVNPNYQMLLLMHLLCFVVAVLSVVLLTISFMCNKINSKVEELNKGIAALVMADGTFVDRLHQEINQASSTKDPNELTMYAAEIFSEKISSEFSAIGKYVDMNRILKKTDFGKQISKLTQGEIAAGKTQEILQAAAGEFTKGIRSKIKSVRTKVLIGFTLLQAVAFGLAFYGARNYRYPGSQSEEYLYYSSDDI